MNNDGNLLAYSTDNTGFRQYRLHVRDLHTGKDLPDTAEKVGSVAWAAGNKAVFYSVEEDKTKRHYRIYRHTIGSDTKDDPIAYEEKDERFNVGVAKSRSGKYLFMESGSHTTSEIRYLEAANPTTPIISTTSSSSTPMTKNEISVLSPHQLTVMGKIVKRKSYQFVPM